MILECPIVQFQTERILLITRNFFPWLSMVHRYKKLSQFEIRIADNVRGLNNKARIEPKIKVTKYEITRF